MNICPICLNAVPDHVDRCPICSAELDLGDPVEIDEEIDWRIVRTVSTEIEARLIAGRLRAEQIPAFVLSQVDTTRGFTVGALAVAKVFVPAQMLAEAEQILATPPVELSDDEIEEMGDESGEESEDEWEDLPRTESRRNRDA